MILDDVLYFVVDDTTRPKYEEKGMHPFSYQKKTGVVNVRKYYAAPEELFEDEEQMTEWAREALETAVKERAWNNFDNYNEGFLFSVKRSQEEYSCSTRRMRTLHWRQKDTLKCRSYFMHVPKLKK